jgi:glucosamine kinase
MIGLGIDGGGSGTRWRLLHRDGKVLGEGSAGPLTGHLFDEATSATAAATLAGIVSEARAIGHPARVVAGIAGLSPSSEIAVTLAQWIAANFELGMSDVQVVDDMRIAYRSAFVPGAGILVYAGTGSVAFHLEENGAASRAGGHGYLIDDAGGGYWIGKQALRAVLRAQDEGMEPGALAQEIANLVGGASWDLTRRYAYGGGRAAVAALTPAVGRAAMRDDSVANTILSAAGEELARLARVLLGRLGPMEVALTGGATKASPLILAHFRAALPRDTAIRHVTRAPVETAAQLAATGAVA